MSELLPTEHSSPVDLGCIRTFAELLQDADELDLLEGDVCENAIAGLRDCATEIELLRSRLAQINSHACYASEEDTEVQPQALLIIGLIARGELDPLTALKETP